MCVCVCIKNLHNKKMIRALEYLCNSLNELKDKFPNDDLYPYALYVVRYYYLYFFAYYTGHRIDNTPEISKREMVLVIDLFAKLSENNLVNRLFCLELVFIRILAQIEKLPDNVGKVFETIRSIPNAPDLIIDGNINKTFDALLKKKSITKAEHENEVHQLVQKHVPPSAPWYNEIAERIMAKFYF